MNKNIYREGGVVVEVTSTLTTTNLNLEKEINKKLFLLKSLKNSVFRGIYYICYEREFLYKKELEKIFLNKISNQIGLLIENGILKEIPISNEYANILYSQNGFNYHNVNKIKLYSFSDFGKNVFLKYKEFIYSKTNKKVINYVETTKKLKDTIKEREDLRFKIISKKTKSLLTAEDLVFIENYKQNGNNQTN